MNFFKMYEKINEELTPDQSGVSEPANDKTASNIIDMIKSLLDKVENDALKKKIQKFIDEMTSTEKKEPSQDKQQQEKPSGPPQPALDANQPMPAPSAPAGQPEMPAANAPPAPQGQPMPPAMPTAGA